MSVIDSLSLGGTTYSLRDNDGRAIIAGTESSTTSAHAYSAGDYFILNDTLYEATASIAVGGTITVGTNCQATTVCGEVSQLKSEIADKVDKTGVGQINERNTTFFSESPNLIDLTDVEDGVRITQNGSGVYEDNGRSTTGYIDVRNINSVTYCYFPNGIKTLTTIYYVLYNANKVALANRSTIAEALDVSSASYIRISFTTAQKDTAMLYDTSKTVSEYKKFGYAFKYDSDQILDVAPTDDIIDILQKNAGKTIRFTDGTYDIIAIYKSKFGNDYFDNYVDYTSGGNNVGRGLPILRGTKIKCTEGAVFTANYTGDNTAVRSNFSAFALESDVEIDGLNLTTTGIRNAIHDDFDNNYSGRTIIKNCKLISDSKVIAGGFALHDYVEINNCYIENTTSNVTADFSYHNNANSGAQSKIIIKDNYFDNGVSLRYYGTSTAMTEALISNNSMANDVEYIPENTTATISNIDIKKWNNTIRS